MDSVTGGKHRFERREHLGMDVLKNPGIAQLRPIIFDIVKSCMTEVQQMYETNVGSGPIKLSFKGPHGTMHSYREEARVKNTRRAWGVQHLAHTAAIPNEQNPIIREGISLMEEALLALNVLVLDAAHALGISDEHLLQSPPGLAFFEFWEYLPIANPEARYLIEPHEDAGYCHVHLADSQRGLVVTRPEGRVPVEIDDDELLFMYGIHANISKKRAVEHAVVLPSEELRSNSRLACVISPQPQWPK